MMRIVDCIQGEPAWFAARAGIPTASEFHTILAKGRDGKSPSLTRKTYMLKLAGEIVTGQPMEGFSNPHMERGKEMEDEARRHYAFNHSATPEQVGFVVNDAIRAGCSPDSFIGQDGALEIKTKLPHLLIELLLKGEFPPEHKAQCQGVLWIAEREWIDLTVFWPRLPPFDIRATRDEPYIKGLSDAVQCFNDELARTVEFVSSYGIEHVARAA